MSKPYVSKERANQPVTASSLDAAIKHGRKRRESLLQAKTVA
jgi:tRNA A-37 threonylcarbamoyl transferase component Bud32